MKNVVGEAAKVRLRLVCAGLCAMFLLAACASRPETGFLTPIAEAGSKSTRHNILVATTRKRDSRPGTYFNGERATTLDFAEIAVSVPQNHTTGEIEWSSTAPGNPRTDFVVNKASYLDGDKEFIRTLNAQLSQRPPGSRKVLLFIHGYNTMFAEGLYRFSQIVHDSKAPAVPVLFTWASRGKLTQYVYDTNSATAARDELDRTIRLIFASDADQVNILAHSMGNWVTVEALRQIKISGKLPPMSKLGTVMLAAPDIDIDVFKSQMRSFGKPRKPFYIIVSKDDKALRASNFIAGGQARLGADENTAELAALGAIVIDMTDVKANDSANHGKFAELAELGPQLRSVLESGVSGTSASPGQAQEAAASSLGAIVTSPISLLGVPIRFIRSR
ncbi:alpha/beta hydrolase (plasmid) [Rhizobium leguminosarum]|uniref:alpha/beta hydrolase n=1 Tax=Rhizobium leguminosarum TaxID=384 RepID=UPI00144240CF|nr:alpha/beta hydrolase [Rhizobium leguminosarum]MBY5838300.1 alpha/beta hydrolase [Rhizobium leguminosarum]NKM77512.1 alpha/beta hydrolase [Rhizobium leguminosarum bv. viciae]QSZ12522.1 alpha/beta hydrolase [Rhizobium leguminosarum]